MSVMILDKIVAQKRLEVNKQKQTFPLNEIKCKIYDTDDMRDFKNAISSLGKVNLIAEIKKASPSRGIIRQDFDPEAIADIYENNGAAAISVLTDKKFFQGELAFLKKVRSVTDSIPLLRKDFIIDEYQIYQSRLAGADAILLIAAILDIEKMKSFLDTAYSLQLDCLVEVHTIEELDTVLNTNAEIIGINNRNLKTFETDIHTTEKLAKRIPRDKVIVSESGIFTKSHVDILRGCGVNAMLVGESLMRSDDIGLKIRQLTSH
ncbi:indole-3-glycerol phosphate synthase TrpC [Candidatus Poribacteria bacterium]|nr:indole-3-glycerol phosphate synthase TrpC [Candidatus Poribacteria bacterium]